jgi:hypothetical protein
LTPSGALVKLSRFAKASDWIPKVDAILGSNPMLYL